jgi:hypothetical protein
MGWRAVLRVLWVVTLQLVIIAVNGSPVGLANAPRDLTENAPKLIGAAAFLGLLLRDIANGINR